MGEFRVDWIAEGDEARLDQARELARTRVLVHASVYASLDCPAIRKRSRLLAVSHGERLVGLAAVVDGIFPFPAVALCASLPGASQFLLSRVDAPFVVLATQPFWHEVERCGGQRELEEIQMARLHPAELPDPDPRLERLTRPEELEALVGSRVSAVHFEAGPFLGVRGPEGDLVACGGVHFVTDRVAQIAYVHTRQDRRREKLATSVLIGLVRELETEQRRVVLQAQTDNGAAMQLYARFGFRGRVRTASFTFAERVAAPPRRSARAEPSSSGRGGPGADPLQR